MKEGVKWLIIALASSLLTMFIIYIFDLIGGIILLKDACVTNMVEDISKNITFGVIE